MMREQKESAGKVNSGRVRQHGDRRERGYDKKKIMRTRNAEAVEQRASCTMVMAMEHWRRDR